MTGPDAYLFTGNDAQRFRVDGTRFLDGSFDHAPNFYGTFGPAVAAGIDVGVGHLGKLGGKHEQPFGGAVGKRRGQLCADDGQHAARAYKQQQNDPTSKERNKP